MNDFSDKYKTSNQLVDAILNDQNKKLSNQIQIVGYIYQDNKIRMLKPNEVFKMMGFSKQDFKKCKELNISDTQLYKMAGNSIAVSILEKIFEELLKNNK